MTVRDSARHRVASQDPDGAAGVENDNEVAAEAVDVRRYRQMSCALREIGELCAPRPERPGGNYMIVGALITGILRTHGLAPQHPQHLQHPQC